MVRFNEIPSIVFVRRFTRTFSVQLERDTAGVVCAPAGHAVSAWSTSAETKPVRAPRSATRMSSSVLTIVGPTPRFSGRALACEARRARTMKCSARGGMSH
jgi:hypothetical protein